MRISAALIFGLSIIVSFIGCKGGGSSAIDCGLATDFTSQLNSTPFSSASWSGPTWGPAVGSYVQNVCNNYQWQRERVMAAYENIAVPSKWNYCHHHSASWYPGTTYSYDYTQGSSDANSSLEPSLYCSAHSFYIGTQDLGVNNSVDFRVAGSLSNLTNGYRWNSAYAQASVPNWSSIVSQETQPGSMGAYLAQLYPTSGAGIDPSWISIASNGSVNVNPALPNFSPSTPSGTYPRQATSQFLNGLDCSDLTAWAYAIALNQSFTPDVSQQAGQASGSTLAAQQLCLNPSLQASGAAGQFVTYNGQVISASIIGSNNLSPILNMLAPGDLLYITQTSTSAPVVHVITWTGKKVGLPGTGITPSTVALDLIAPAEANSGTGRMIGDWVIIDSHFQGADYRDFSGWYVNSLWGVRRVIGVTTPQCSAN